MGMSAGNQAGDWLVQIREMRTQNALRVEAPSEDEVRRLSDRALLAAAHNPDHSTAARTAAAAELRARGASADPWRIVVPGFISAADLAKGERLFFGWLGALRRRSGAFAVLGAAGLGGIAALYSDFAADGAAPHWLAFMGGFGLVFLRGFAGVLAGLFRTKPARVALLRPSASVSTNAPLRRMIARELKPYGHIVSLAPEARAGAIRAAAEYRADGLALRNRFGMNLRAMAPSGEALALSASDAWRPMVLDLLMESSDAVIIDLSGGGAWTLDALSQAGASPRCVFVSIWGRLEEAEAALRERGVSAPCFYYAPDGEMQRRPEFRAALLAALRAAHGAAA
jgi:hypothetical protein